MPLSRDDERVVGGASYGSAQQQQLESANQQLQQELARVAQELAATKARQQHAQATLSTQASNATKVVLRRGLQGTSPPSTRHRNFLIKKTSPTIRRRHAVTRITSITMVIAATMLRGKHRKIFRRKKSSVLTATVGVIYLLNVLADRIVLIARGKDTHSGLVRESQFLNSRIPRIVTDSPSPSLFYK